MARDTMRKKWPNFFTAGVPKAGTTSLYAVFRHHPDMYTAEIKEPNFFNRSVVPDNALIKPVRDEKYYLKLYEKAYSEPILCDMSISLFEDPTSCRQILEVSPDAKILICLRDQVERMFSLYLMLKRNGRIHGSFREELERGLDEAKYVPGVPGMKLKKRLYAENLSLWLDSFRKENIKVILFEEFIADQHAILNSIFEFLGIAAMDKENQVLGAHNTYGEPRNLVSKFVLKNIRSKKLYSLFPYTFRKFVRDSLLLKAAEKPLMENDDRMFLKDFFIEDTLEVQKILARQLPWKNFADVRHNPTA